MIDKNSYIDLECLSYNTLMELFIEAVSNKDFAEKKYVREYATFKECEFTYKILKEEVERRKMEENKK